MVNALGSFLRDRIAARVPRARIGDLLLLITVQLVHDHACGHVPTPPLIRGHHAKIELQRVSKRCDSLGTSCILRYDNRLPPARDIMLDPASDKRLGVEVVNRAFEEALHLGCVEVDGDDVLNAGHIKEVRQHPGGYRAPVRLLLGLAAVGEVGKNSYSSALAFGLR